MSEVPLYRCPLPTFYVVVFTSNAGRRLYGAVLCFHEAPPAPKLVVWGLWCAMGVLLNSRFRVSFGVQGMGVWMSFGVQGLGLSFEGWGAGVGDWSVGIGLNREAGSARGGARKDDLTPPLSSPFGTNQTAKARFWPWLSDNSSWNHFNVFLFTRQKTPPRSGVRPSRLKANLPDALNYNSCLVQIWSRNPQISGRMQYSNSTVRNAGPVRS